MVGIVQCAYDLIFVFRNELVHVSQVLVLILLRGLEHCQLCVAALVPKLEEKCVVGHDATGELDLWKQQRCMGVGGSAEPARERERERERGREPEPERARRERRQRQFPQGRPGARGAGAARSAGAACRAA